MGEARSGFSKRLLLLLAFLLAGGCASNETLPPAALTYHVLGLTYLNKGQYAQAIADYNRALEINPRSALVYTNRAQAHYSLKDYSKAWDDVQKAQELGAKIDPQFLKDLREASSREK